MAISIGVNMEFIRHEDQPFAAGVGARRNSAFTTSSRWSTTAANC